MKYDTVIFDFDGPIVDSVTVELLGAVHHLSRKAGVPKEKFPTLEIIYERYTADWQIMYQSFGIKMADKELDSTFREVYDRERAPLAPGIKKFLEQLKKRKVKMAIVSHGDREPIERILKREEMSGLFRYVWGGYFDEQGKAVDKSKKVLEICEKFKTKPEKVLFVGDMQPEIEAGERAGCDVAIIIPEPKNREIPFNPRPTYYVRSYVELAKDIGL